MGSLTSKPKAVSSVQPQIVYVPQTSVTSPATPTPPTNGGADTGTTTPAPTPEAARKSSLLSRDRGRFGTILTGFKGLLDSITGQNANGNPARKTLLGE